MCVPFIVVVACPRVPWPPVDEISQRRNVRWVRFMLLSTIALPKNVTEGINPPFWAEDPSMTL